MKRDTWSSDVPVSKPIPTTDRPIMVDFGGFGFTTGGLAHNATQDDLDAIFFPLFAPEGQVPGER